MTGLGAEVPPSMAGIKEKILARAVHMKNKAEAQIEGRMKFDGLPCKHGHIIRYANTGGCVGCAENRNSAAREKNRKPSLPEQIADLREKLKSALDAEARAWARVAELEDKYEPGQHGEKP